MSNPITLTFDVTPVHDPGNAQSRAVCVGGFWHQRLLQSVLAFR
jgi:hypothetical protein